MDAADVGGMGGHSSCDRRWRVRREAGRLNLKAALADRLLESAGAHRLRECSNGTTHTISG